MMTFTTAIESSSGMLPNKGVDSFSCDLRAPRLSTSASMVLMSSATFMVKLLIRNMTFIAYLFGHVHVLGWKILRLVLEFEKSVMSHNTNSPTRGLRRLGPFTKQSDCDPIVR